MPAEIYWGREVVKKVALIIQGKTN